MVESPQHMLGVIDICLTTALSSSCPSPVSLVLRIWNWPSRSSCGRVWQEISRVRYHGRSQSKKNFQNVRNLHTRLFPHSFQFEDFAWIFLTFSLAVRSGVLVLPPGGQHVSQHLPPRPADRLPGLRDLLQVPDQLGQPRGGEEVRGLRHRLQVSPVNDHWTE